MELSEKDLENIVGGVPHEIAEQKVEENSGLFRKKTIENLKQAREEILKEQELSLEELEEVKAGVPKI